MQVECPKCLENFNLAAGLDGQCPNCKNSAQWYADAEEGLLVRWGNVRDPLPPSQWTCKACGKPVRVVMCENGSCGYCGSRYVWVNPRGLGYSPEFQWLKLNLLDRYSAVKGVPEEITEQECHKVLSHEEGHGPPIDHTGESSRETLKAALSRNKRQFEECIRDCWSFSQAQQHTHSWHDREDFLERVLPKLLEDFADSLTQVTRLPLTPDDIDWATDHVGHGYLGTEHRDALTKALNLRLFGLTPDSEGWEERSQQTQEKTET